LSLDRLLQLIPPQHVAFVDDILRRYGVPDLPDDDADRGTGDDLGEGMIFSAERASPQIDIALSRKTALVANALGPPTPDMIERVKAEGRRIGALAGSAQHAERHVAAGVDIVVAQGYEAGGHTGEIGTIVLIPEIVDALGDVPVLGAGGIGRGRQMAAAMALGAAGVWCGSVWLTTQEAETHPVVKDKFLAARSADTVRSRSRTGKPARQLRSAWTDEWDNPETPAPLGMPMQPILVHRALERIDRAAHNKGSGAEQLANYYVGQIVGSMKQTKSSAQVVYEMIDEFIEAVGSLAQQLEL
jgi:NAD(P)H-dependent flavin oxidoreductase YrpB (nitropropane dioxygenase family)